MSATATPTKNEPRYEKINNRSTDGVEDIPNEDDGIFVPEERFPLVMRIGGNRKVFEAIISAGKAATDAKEREQYAKQAKMSLAVTGYFFISEERVAEAGIQITDDYVPEGWQRFTATLGEKETPGFATRNIKIAVIRMRRIRELKRDSKNKNLPKKHGWYIKMTEEQKGNYQTRMQILCYVKGLEEAGPMVVTMKTTAVTSMLGDRRERLAGIFNPLDGGEGADSYFYKYVLGPANKELKKTDPKGKVPQNHYWLEITNEVDAKGFPAWKKIEYGEKGPTDFTYVCPLMWAEYPNVLAHKFDYKKLYVGKDLAIEGDQVRRETGEWQHRWSDHSAEAIAALNRVVNTNEQGEENDEGTETGVYAKTSAPPPEEGERWEESEPHAEEDLF